MTTSIVVVGFIAAVICPPICEEAIMRGAILSNFRSIKKDWVIVLIMGLFEFGAFALHQAINLQLVSSGTDPLLISLVNVVSGVATLVGSLVSSRICDHIPVGRGIVAILTLTAVGYLPLLLSGGYESIVLNAVLVSLPMPLFSALVNGFVFSKTPVERQGRTRAAVMTTVMLFGSCSGALAGELLPALIGTRSSCSARR